MDNKGQLILQLREELNLWEDLLAGIHVERITSPDYLADRSIKDIIAHLTAWQQISVTRMEAARNQTKPEYPE